MVFKAEQGLNSNMAPEKMAKNAKLLEKHDLKHEQVLALKAPTYKIPTFISSSKASTHGFVGSPNTVSSSSSGKGNE